MTVSRGGDTDPGVVLMIGSAAIDTIIARTRVTGGETMAGTTGESTDQGAASISDEKTALRDEHGMRTRSAHGHGRETDVGDEIQEAGHRIRGLTGEEIECSSLHH